MKFIKYDIPKEQLKSILEVLGRGDRVMLIPLKDSIKAEKIKNEEIKYNH